MLSPVEELKIQAKRLLKQTPLHTSLLVLSKNQSPQLKHAQRLIARHYGFMDWEHARRILSCENFHPGLDCGSFWYSSRCAVLLNHWCANYQDACELRAEKGGILLPYKTQYVVAEEAYIRLIGLDTEDNLWGDIQNDWCQGPSAARQQLALKRIRAIGLAAL